MPWTAVARSAQNFLRVYCAATPNVIKSALHAVKAVRPKGDVGYAIL